jgi:hypothetical protein
MLRNNIISRSASIGLKFISTTALTSVNNTIEDNFIYDNEIGMSISGHVAGDYRYVNMNVTKNVVSQTGLGAHTGRSLGWAIDTQDYDTADISENFILLQTVPTNSQGLATTASPSYRNVSIHDNMFYAVNGNSITNTPYAAWTGNTIANNFILAVPGGSCAIQNTGAFTGIAFSNNRYSGTNAFCLNTTHTTLSAWNTASGETGSSMFTGTLVDPTRTVATYATSLGYASVDAFFQAATSMNQLNWDDKLTAPAINAYIKAGFKLN